MTSDSSSSPHSEHAEHAASPADGSALSAEFLRRVIDGISDSLVVIDLDFNVLFANRAARRLEGDPSPVARPVKCYEYLHRSDAPCDRESCECPVKRARNGEFPVATVHTHVDANGLTFPVEVVATPVIDGSGDVTGVIELSRDISGRRHAAEALRESEEKWRSLVENAPISIAILDLDGVIVYANRVVDGLKVDPVPGASIYDYIPPEQREKVITALGHVRHTGESAEFETPIRTPGQPERTFSFRVAAIMENGEVRAFMTTGVDITKRTRAERDLSEYRDRLEQLVETRSRELKESHDRLQRAERLASMGAFAAGIAHEINNPLASIMMTARHALRSRDDQHLVRTLLTEIIADSERCARIVKGVLQFARRGPSEKWRVDLNDIVRRAVEQARRYGERRGVHVSSELCGSPPTVRGNPVDLEQTVTNVLNNAIEASTVRQAVRVRTENADGAVRIVVRDDGCGMSEAACSRAFDPFFTTRTREGGTGLGLSMVHGTISDHGGVIRIESRPHVGTTVTIELPRQSRDAEGDQPGGKHADI